MSSTSVRISLLFSAVALAIGVASLGSVAFAAAGGPTVALTSVTASTTNAASIPVTVTFSEGVTGFASTDIQTTNGTASALSGSGSAYTFTLTPTADGTVTAQVPADATLSVASSTGNQDSNVISFMSDKTAPIISGVSVATTSSTATITWTTSEAAAGQAAYGTTIGYGSTSTLEPVAGTSHSTVLSGLAPSTTYHFKLSATDAAGNVGTSTDATFMTGAAAPTAPVLSNISSNSTGTTTESITWTTDAAATGRVFYGTTTGYGSSTTLNASSSTSHSFSLSGLSEATLYHFIVVSSDVGGTATSTDQAFTSGSSASTTPLSVSGIDAVSTTATADGSFADGFKWVLHFIVPSTETNFKMKFADFTTPSSAGTIPTAANVRYYSAQSSNAASSTSAIVETDTNYGGALLLTGDTSTTTPGRQIDVSVEVAVPVGTPTGVYSTIFGAQSTP